MPNVSARGTLRNCRLTDVARISACVSRDTDEGHYARQGPKLAQDRGFEANLNQIIRRGQRLDANFPAQAAIYTEAGEDVGFAITTPAVFQVRNHRPVQELWMAAVFPEKRGMEAGSRMIDEVLDRLSKQNSVFARCLPASIQMKAMLRRRGFVPIGRGETHKAVFLFLGPPEQTKMLREAGEYGRWQQMKDELRFRLRWVTRRDR